MNALLAALTALNIASAFYVAAQGHYGKAMACILLALLLTMTMKGKPPYE